MSRKKTVLVLGLFLGVAFCQVSLQAFEGQMGAPIMPKIIPMPTATPTKPLRWFLPPQTVWQGRHRHTSTPTPTCTPTPTPGNSILFH